MTRRAAEHGAVDLVERDEELAALQGAYEGDADTRGSVVVIGGAVGTGKTALLRAWTERVAPDALVLTATACRAERDLPLGVLEQLVRGCPELPAATAERTLAWCDEAATAPAPLPPSLTPPPSLTLAPSPSPSPSPSPPLPLPLAPSPSPSPTLPLPLSLTSPLPLRLSLTSPLPLPLTSPLPPPAPDPPPALAPPPPPTAPPPAPGPP
ncbi:ATP-binding protein [Streptomyces sp. Je 1-369]|uniref:ATP-binding protein n=1 Tax=Streptomyces sp. Je 1-369 TaxID=2966192 RepID=UPI002286C677|nr:ATP-binding protein [Streptomyces sp. Je 1-369]WAL99216.1 ATP-binding protein [Streptomyces sp. Je 1-369]